MRKSLLVWGIMSWMLLILPVYGQPEPEVEDNPVVQRMLDQGKRALDRGNYGRAIRYFEEAAEAPACKQSTAAIYFVGLSHFFAGNSADARQWFAHLMLAYPGSRYVPEAQYHIALIDLNSEHSPIRESGLFALLQLATNDSLEVQHDAHTLLFQYLYEEASLLQVETYATRIPEPLLGEYVEVLCYHYIREGEPAQASRLLAQYESANPEWDNTYARSWVENYLAQASTDTIATLALVLPLHLAEGPPDSLKALPFRQRMPVEFYQGFKLAMRTYDPLARKHVYVKVFDSQKNDSVLTSILPEIADFNPDMVVGDVYSAQAAVLSEWTEQQRVPQLVPLSPRASLTEDKSHVFLAHPSADRHGEAMAEYAWRIAGLSKVAVWNDRHRGTRVLASGFQRVFEELGGEVIMLEADSLFDPKGRKAVILQVRDLREQAVDGVYLPMGNNEEVAGMILSEIQLQRLQVRVMGAPQWWQRYEHIDRDMKERYGLMFTTGYMPERKGQGYDDFFWEYMSAFQFPPSVYSVQGYDIGMYVLSLLDAYEPSFHGSLADFMRAHPPHQGLHQEIDFLGQQVNQFVNIGTFQADGTVIKLNGRPTLELTPNLEEDSVEEDDDEAPYRRKVGFRTRTP